MIRRVVEISNDGLFLSKNRGFLRIQRKNDLVGEVPLSDIAVLILTAKGLTFTKDILLSLNSQGTPIIFCGKNYLPESILNPIFGNYEFSGRLKSQLDVTMPQKKQLWKRIVKEKINNQAIILETIGKKKNAELLKAISEDVNSGDTTNREAVAARAYWTFLFGENFQRKQDDEVGINAYLNYGYAIVRGIIARSVSITGLLPSLGLHHSGNKNNYCLVDDLMEPFRPIVDLFVYSLSRTKELEELTSFDKSHLATIANIDLLTEKGKSSTIVASENYVHSLYESYKNKEVSLLCIPKIIKEEITEQTNPLPF